MGIWRVTGSTRLQNLAVYCIFVFNSTPNGNKFGSALNRVGVLGARQKFRAGGGEPTPAGAWLTATRRTRISCSPS
eukprot:565926-Pelagomonas_calceolata.AAC.1